MIAMAVAMGIGRFVYTPILPGMMDELGLSPAEAGWIASANYLGYLVGALAAAGDWARGRERPLMLTSLAANALLAGLMGFCATTHAFVIIRFLAGMASAFVMVFMSSIVFTRLAADRREDLQSLHFGGVGLGIAASAAMMAVLVSGHSGWAAGWFWSGVISLCGLGVVALMIGGAPATSARAIERGEALPANRSLIGIIVAYGLFGFGYVITATFLIAIVRQGGGGRVFEAMVWLVTGLTAFASLGLWQKVAGRLGLNAAYAVACLVEAVGVAASVALGGRTGPLLAGLLLGGTFMALTALGLQAARRLAPRASRRIFALMTAAFGLGQIIGPIAAGMLAQASGSFALASILAAFVLVASGALAWAVAPKSP